MLRAALPILCLFAAAGAVAQPRIAADEPDPLVEGLRARIDRQQYQAVADSVGPLIERARAEGDSVRFLRLVCTRGQAELGIGRPSASLLSLRRAASMAESYGDTNTLLLALGVEALALNYLGRFEETLSKIDRRLELARLVGNARSVAFAHLSAGFALLSLSRLVDARMEYDQAIAGFQQSGERYWQITALVGRGRIETNLGDIDAARRTFGEVIGVARETGDLRNEIDAINNLGVLEYRWGDIGKAAQHFEQAQAMALEHGDPQQAVVMMTNAAMMRWFLGEVRAAEDVFEDALRIAEAAESPPVYYGTLRSYGQMQLERGRLARAEEILRRVVAESPLLALRVQAASSLASGLSYAGRSEAALEILSLADPADLNVTDPLDEENYALRRSRVLHRLGRSEEALAQLLPLTEAREEETSPSLASAVAYSHAQVGDHDEAMRWLHRAAAARSRARASTNSLEWRDFLQGQVSLIFADAVAAIARLENSDADRAELFRVLQQNKARNLAERIQSPRRTEHAKLSDARELGEVRESILQPNELLLDYHAGTDLLLLVAVRRDAARFFVVEMPPGEFDERVRRFRDAIAESRGSSASRIVLEATAARLGEVVVGPARSMFDGIERVLVSPDGPFSSIPFELLSVPTESDTLRLRDFELARVPSISIRPLLSPNATARPGVATLRGPDDRLRGAKSETDYLERHFRNVRAADEEQLLHPPVGCTVLHVAAHTDVDAERPWQSGIRVRADEDSASSRDTHLRARELLDTQLDVHLAVLATCGSGLGRITAGEGVMGLSTAFLVANVPSVIATLWPVDDVTTSDLMESFYRGLAEGSSVSAALRFAQAELRRDPATAHPYYWAGFFVMGRGEIPVRLEMTGVLARHGRLLFAATLLVLLLGWIWRARRERRA